MCIINVTMRPSASTIITDEVIQANWQSNHDGAGIVYLKNNRWRMIKGLMTLEDFTKALRSIETLPHAWHFRYATHGLKDKANTHPFNIGKDTYMMHNGIFRLPGTATQSDTSMAADFIKMSPPDTRQEYVTNFYNKFGNGSRVIIFTYDKNGKPRTVKYGRWVKGTENTGTGAVDWSIQPSTIAYDYSGIDWGNGHGFDYDYETWDQASKTYKKVNRSYINGVVNANAVAPTKPTQVNIPIPKPPMTTTTTTTTAIITTPHVVSPVSNAFKVMTKEIISMYVKRHGSVWHAWDTAVMSHARTIKGRLLAKSTPTTTPQTINMLVSEFDTALGEFYQTCDTMINRSRYDAGELDDAMFTMTEGMRFILNKVLSEDVAIPVKDSYLYDISDLQVKE